MADGEVMLLPFLQGLCQRLQADTVAASDQIPLGMHKELGRLLKALLTLIQETTLKAAEKKPGNKCKAIQSWLRDLQQAAYDAGDFLNSLPLRPPEENDMLQDELLQHSCRCLSIHSISPERDTQLIIKDIRRRVEKLVKKQPPHAKFHLHDLQQSDRGIHNKVQSLGIPPDEPRVLGRDEDREKIIQLLTSEESSRVDLSLIAIVGRECVGKTTLARLVYDDERVASHFQLKFWVTASEIHDTGSLLRSTALLLKRHELNFKSPFRNEDDWKAKLTESRFLLVLDDFHCGVIEWARLCEQLKTELSGSKILIIVEEDIPKNMGLMNLSYHLKDLSHEDSWSLFKECAFHDLGTGQNSTDFEEVGMEIVAKLEGLPPAARMIGCLLCSNVNLEDWKMILNSDVWKSKPDELHGIPAALWLSYQHLPPHIKACFSYCSVFPEDHRFIKESLVHMWIAQGLIQPQEGTIMEDLAGEYFDYLLHSSFLSIQHNDISVEPESKYIIMHKMIRRLAIAVTLDESLCLSRGADQSFEDIERSHCSQEIHKRMEVRHLYLQSDCLPLSEIQEVSMLCNIETLVFYGTNGSCFNYDALFKKLKSIRVLYLSDMELEVLPKSIGKLKQLRCLDLSNTSIEMLPKEVCSLLNLQTLRLTTRFYCSPKFPNGMSKLISLRHLIACWGFEIHKIGRLRGLQELEMFIASRRDGYKIEELKYMNQLRGCLCISDLNNVHSEEEAKEAMLNDKKLLGELYLRWSSQSSEDDGNTRAQVYDLALEALKPHPNLKELSIQNYLGTKTPSWLENASLCNLEFLCFDECPKLDLVLLGQLQSLKTLRVIGSRKLHRLSSRVWNGGEDIQLFPHLCILEIMGCASLVELIPLPPTLEELKLDDVGLQVLPGFQQSKCSTSSFSLTSLDISKCHRLTTLQVGLLEHQNHHQLQVLQSLTIVDCPKLVHLPDHGFSGLISLKYLHIENCKYLECRPVDNANWRLMNKNENGNVDFQHKPRRIQSNANLPSSLIELKIIECPRLTNDSFLKGLERLHSLTSLVIRNAFEVFSSSNQPRQHPQLTSLPREVLQHLKALKELDIANCEGLELLGFQSLVSLKNLNIDHCPKLDACSSPADTAPLPLEYLEIGLCSLVLLTGGVLRRLDSLVVLKLRSLRAFQCFPKSMEEGFQCLVSLQKLHIYECHRLQSLPDDLVSIPSLKELYIIDCDVLQSLPEKGVPPSLELLVIQNCSSLGLRCRIGGAEWPKISHVFFVQVDGRSARDERPINSFIFS